MMPWCPKIRCQENDTYYISIFIKVLRSENQHFHAEAKVDPFVPRHWMNLHKGKIIRSIINTSNFVGILDGPFDLLFKVLIMSKTSSVEHGKLWNLADFCFSKLFWRNSICRSYGNIPFCGGPYIYNEIVKFVRDTKMIVNYFSIYI